ncbi:branched-chain amino acid aminotransferase [Bacillus sp. EB600]|uniref:branched-chain amino acid aminotransferase n=1 Tax=Bacillus sp. EB600 TaxID=2806345 RepID=UPI00210E2CC6|nr:branched-chain amino acid aminotransferase [Bacillus sp. EB600]
MLKDRIIQDLTKRIEEQQTLQKKDNVKVELFNEELNYSIIHQLIPEDVQEKISFVEKNADLRLSNAYIERCDKETEEMISKEESDFLKQPLEFLKKHKNEFIYFESEWLDLIGVDAISLEADDVFGTYDVMLGLKLQKKYETVLREQLNRFLSGEEPKFDLVFNHDDGLWDLNFTLNYVAGFKNELSVGETFLMIYRFLFNLVDQVESNH